MLFFLHILPLLILTERRKFEDLESSVAEAAEHNIITDDVKKAEGGQHQTTSDDISMV